MRFSLVRALSALLFAATPGLNAVALADPPPAGDVVPLASKTPAVGQIAAANPAGAITQIVPVGTPVRLMFLKELSSRTAHPGDRFRLRVDQSVVVDGQTVVPVGAIAWGEMLSVTPNGAAGVSGKMAARLLYLDLPQGHLPLKGEVNNKGNHNDEGLAMAIWGFGIFGLLSKGDSARFKAGDIINATVDSIPSP